MKKSINLLIKIYLLILPVIAQQVQKKPQEKNKVENIYNHIENQSNSQKENQINSQNNYPNNNQNIKQNNIKNNRNNNQNPPINCNENKNNPNYLKEELEQVFEELKLNIPLFMNNMKNTSDPFSQLKPKEPKEKYIKEEVNFESIRENFESNQNQKNRKQIIEKENELFGFLTQKDCTNLFNFTLDIFKDEIFKEYKNGKKEFLSKVIKSIKDYVQCNSIVELIIQGASNNKKKNFKYILFLIYEISSNPGSLKEGQSEVLYNISLCLEKYFNIYWGSVERETSDYRDKIDEKEDISLILFKTLSNLINIHHDDEIDGYHDEIINKSKFGIMRDEQAKKLHKEILDFSHQFYDFGNGANINSIMNISILKFDDLNDEKLFEQEIFYDIPFVPLDDSNNNDNDNIARDFICISIFDENGDEINFADLQEEDKPIYYNHKKNRNMKQCIFFNESKEDLDKDEITPENNIIYEEEF